MTRPASGGSCHFQPCVVFYARKDGMEPFQIREDAMSTQKKSGGVSPWVYVLILVLLGAVAWWVFSTKKVSAEPLAAVDAVPISSQQTAH